MKKFLIFSGSRSEYGLLKSLLKKLNKLGTLKFEQKISRDKTLFLPFFKEDTLIKSGKIKYGPLDLGHRASYDQFEKFIDPLFSSSFIKRVIKN